MRIIHIITRYVFLFIFVSIVISCKKQTENVTPPAPSPKVEPIQEAEIKKYKFTLDIPNLQSGQYGLAADIDDGISGTILYKSGGVEHIITHLGPNNRQAPPPLHFIKKSDKWEFEGFYWSGAMDGARNYSFLDDQGTFVISDHGTETYKPWPLGYLWLVKTEGEKLSFSRINKGKSFYHSVATGDIDNDGRPDIVGVKFPSETTEDWTNSALEPYIQNSQNQFIANRNIVKSPSDWHETSGSAALIADVMGDKRPEIIKGEYKGIYEPTKRYGVAIYTYNAATNRYEVSKSFGPAGIFSNLDQGVTSIKTIDFNKDSKIDLVVATEGNPGVHVHFWAGDGQGNFKAGQVIAYTKSEINFREFEVMDFDNDGWQDVVIHPFHHGKLFRPNSNGDKKTDGVILQNLMLKNTNGEFKAIQRDFSYPTIAPGYLKGFMIAGKLKFIGFDGSKYNDGKTFDLIEIVPKL